MRWPWLRARVSSAPEQNRLLKIDMTLVEQNDGVISVLVRAHYADGYVQTSEPRMRIGDDLEVSVDWKK